MFISQIYFYFLWYFLDDFVEMKYLKCSYFDEFEIVKFGGLVMKISCYDVFIGFFYFCSLLFLVFDWVLQVFDFFLLE